MSEPLQVENNDTKFLDILSQEKDIIENVYEKYRNIADSLIKFYELKEQFDENTVIDQVDTTEFEKVYDEMEAFFANQYPEAAKDLVKLSALHKEYQDLIQKALKQQKEINKKSYSIKAKNFDTIFSLDLKKQNLDLAQSKVGKITNVELTGDGKPLELKGLSKEQYLKLLNAEKNKRAELDFKNEKILRPKLGDVQKNVQSYQDMELRWKNVFDSEIKSVDRSMQNFRKREGIVLEK